VAWCDGVLFNATATAGAGQATRRTRANSAPRSACCSKRSSTRLRRIAADLHLGPSSAQMNELP
jgi:hypothetical protein